jgi:nucleoside permease NupC
MHIYRSGVFVTYPFSSKMKLLQPRISLLISLILVGFNSITDTRILYDIVKALYDTRHVLIKGRFRDINNDKSFARSI